MDTVIERNSGGNESGVTPEITSYKPTYQDFKEPYSFA